jgi:hypothetical protein
MHQCSPQTPPFRHHGLGGEEEFLYMTPMTMEEKEFLDGSIVSCLALGLICMLNLLAPVTIHATEEVFVTMHATEEVVFEEDKHHQHNKTTGVNDTS